MLQCSGRLVALQIWSGNSDYAVHSADLAQCPILIGQTTGNAQHRGGCQSHPGQLVQSIPPWRPAGLCRDPHSGYLDTVTSSHPQHQHAHCKMLHSGAVLGGVSLALGHAVPTVWFTPKERAEEARCPCDARH